MATKPDAAAIVAEIKKLKELKSMVPKRSMFGDDNHAAIDAQIVVLQDFPSLTEEQIYSRWSDDVANGAIDAFNWLNGEESESPSEGWAPWA